MQRIRRFSSLRTIVVCFVLVSLATAPKSPLLAKDARNGAPAAGSERGQKYPPTIVFMTDFGVLDDSVTICRGVMYGIMPDVRIVDLTHRAAPERQLWRGPGAGSILCSPITGC